MSENPIETMAVLMESGILVLPDYMNTIEDAYFKEYGYGVKGGNVVDNVAGKALNTLGMVHTHPSGGVPSGYDGLFSTNIPLKPFFVMQLGGVNKVSWTARRYTGEPVSDVAPSCSPLVLMQGNGSLVLSVKSPYWKTVH